MNSFHPDHHDDLDHLDHHEIRTCTLLTPETVAVTDTDGSSFAAGEGLRADMSDRQGFGGQIHPACFVLLYAASDSRGARLSDFEPKHEPQFEEDERRPRGGWWILDHWGILIMLLVLALVAETGWLLGSNTQTKTTLVLVADAPAAPSANPSANTTVPATSSATVATTTWFGYITAFEVAGGSTVIVFDKAELYTGAEARRENVKDGHPPDCCMNVYIRNTNTLKRRYRVTSSTTIEAIDPNNCCVSHRSNVAGLKRAKQLGGNTLPVHIKLRGNKLLAIAQQYLP